MARSVCCTRLYTDEPKLAPLHWLRYIDADEPSEGAHSASGEDAVQTTLAVLVHRFLHPRRVAALAVDSTQCGYKE